MISETPNAQPEYGEIFVEVRLPGKGAKYMRLLVSTFELEWSGTHVREEWRQYISGKLAHLLQAALGA